MMMNLFSIFDPSTSMNLSLNWFSLIIPLMFIPNLYWLIPSMNQLLFNKISMMLFKEYLNLSTKFIYNIFMFNKMMMFLMISNLMSLFPYIFNPLSHMSMSLSISMPLWMTLMIFGWMKFTNNMFLHLVPKNTPTMLMPLMVMIETVSNLIRPMTLSIRISANMIAGHLLMTLIGNQFFNNMNMFIIILITQTLLMILELAVACIQAYVFSTLSILYSNEI